MGTLVNTPYFDKCKVNTGFLISIQSDYRLSSHPAGQIWLKIRIAIEMGG